MSRVVPVSRAIEDEALDIRCRLPFGESPDGNNRYSYLATPSNRAINIRLPVRENKYHVFVRSFGLDVVPRHLFFPVPKYELLPHEDRRRAQVLDL